MENEAARGKQLSREEPQEVAFQRPTLGLDICLLDRDPASSGILGVCL
jgi:hypothetical protein